LRSAGAARGPPLTGRFERDERHADLDAVMREIDDARMEEAARLLRA
jgi:RIO kinase 1